MTDSASDFGFGEKLLTPRDVADILRLSVKTVYDHCSRSKTKLPHIRIGSSVRFRACDLRQWLAANVQCAGVLLAVGL